MSANEETQTRRPRWLDAVLFNLRVIAIYEITIVAAIVAVCLIFGWTARQDISAALMIGGAFVFSVGPFSMMGGWGNTRNWGYVYTRTMVDQRADERTAFDWHESKPNMPLMFQSMLLGSLTIAIAVMFDILAR